MLIDFLIFVSVIIIIFILYNVYTSLKIVERKEGEKKKIEDCDFRISKPKFRKIGTKQYADFVLHLHKKHMFFIDLPIIFRFYSDSRFKSKIKINYSTPKGDQHEKLVNKTIIFETNVHESKRYITDTIVGKITFELELDTEYGHPIVDFMIPLNCCCKLSTPINTTIKFPK